MTSGQVGLACLDCAGCGPSGRGEGQPDGATVCLGQDAGDQAGPDQAVDQAAGAAGLADQALSKLLQGQAWLVGEHAEHLGLGRGNPKGPQQISEQAVALVGRSMCFQSDDLTEEPIP